MTFETFDQSDEETWPDQRKDNDKDKDNDNDKNKANDKAFKEHPQRVILETCDPWDIWSKWQGDMTWNSEIFQKFIHFGVDGLPSGKYLFPLPLEVEIIWQ